MNFIEDFLLDFTIPFLEIQKGIKLIISIDDHWSLDCWQIYTLPIRLLPMCFLLCWHVIKYLIFTSQKYISIKNCFVKFPIEVNTWTFYRCATLLHEIHRLFIILKQTMRIIMEWKRNTKLFRFFFVSFRVCIHFWIHHNWNKQSTRRECLKVTVKRHKLFNGCLTHRIFDR